MNSSLRPARNVGVLWIAPERRHGHDPVPQLAERGVSVTRLTTARSALELLDSPDLVVPHCVFVDPSAAGMHTLLLAMRAQPRLSHIPVVYVSDRVGQDVLDSAHAVGADDVFWTGDEGWLPALVEQLTAYHPEERPPLGGGVAFVLHASQERRRMLGRVYRNAGFQVVFGAGEEDLMQYAGDGSRVDVIVSSEEAIGGGREAVGRLRKRVGHELPWILLNDDEHAAGLAGVHGDGRIASTGEDGPTENVLFLTQELLAGAHAGRRSPRLLLNGLCAFRPSDERSYRQATLYNINRDGLYVRTLVPMARGEAVHLELVPPDCTECIHLAGVVARSSGLTAAADLTPPGFAVQLLTSHCSQADLRLYLDAYEELASNHQRGVRHPSAVQLQPYGKRASRVPNASGA